MVASDRPRGELKQRLGAGSLLLLGLGCVLGSGIFVMPGYLAATAGPGVVLSIIAAGAFSLIIALCYSELATALPSAGSAYAYTYVAMGRVAGWITGLLILLAYGLAVSLVAVGWSGYFVSVLSDIGLSVPPWLLSAPGETGAVNAPALIAVAIATVLLCMGVTTTSLANNVLTLFKVGVIVAFIVLGLSYVNPANWTPFIPAGDGVLNGVAALFGSTPATLGIGGVIAAAPIMFFAFAGFEAPSTASEEARNTHSLPFAMIMTVIICTVLYCGVALIATGVTPYSELAGPAPVAAVAAAMGFAWLAPLIKLAALAGLSTVLLTLLYAQTRVFMAMTRDGLMPPIFARLNSAGAPAVGAVATGAAAAAIAAFVPLAQLGALSTIGMTAVFGIACLAVLVLRRTSPDLDRPFKTPLFPILPVVGVVGCAVLLYTQVSTLPLAELAVFFVAGFALFFISGAWRITKAASTPSERAPRAPAPQYVPTPAPTPPPMPAEPAPRESAQSPTTPPERTTPAPAPPPPRSAPAPAPFGVSDVFISYKRTERDRVEAIAAALRDLGLNVWFDARLQAGMDFDEEINREVRSAKAVLVCWSQGAVESRWVRAESSIGHKRNVLVACFLEECDPWTPFNLVHTEDLSGARLDGTNAGWVKIVDRIGKLSGRPGLTDALSGARLHA